MTAQGWTARRPAPDAPAGGTADLATSFELRAGEYARLRPGYPAAAVNAALPDAPSHVLDLAAGTGKLTAAVLGKGHRVLAVEPLAGMLAHLHRLLPSADAVAGTAEDLPVADRVIDAITVGQAFHWFDQSRALREMARVLRPGGTLSLLWNHDDERHPMVRDIEAALDRTGRPAGGSTGRGRAGHGADRENGDPGTEDQSENQSQEYPPRRPPFVGYPHFTDPELVEIAWHRRLSVTDFIALQHTYSYVIRASDEARADLGVELQRVIRDHVGTADAVTLPVICQVWRSVRR